MPSLEIFPTLVAWVFPPSTARQSLGQDWKVKMDATDLSEFQRYDIHIQLYYTCNIVYFPIFMHIMCVQHMYTMYDLNWKHSLLVLKHFNLGCIFHQGPREEFQVLGRRDQQRTTGTLALKGAGCINVPPCLADTCTMNLRFKSPWE